MLQDGQAHELFLLDAHASCFTLADGRGHGFASIRSEFAESTYRQPAQACAFATAARDLGAAGKNPSFGHWMHSTHLSVETCAIQFRCPSLH